jgi:hypothetical protein
MRKLPLLLALSLLAMLGSALPAQAAPLLQPAQMTALLEPEGEEEAEAEDLEPEEAADEDEACEPEEGEPCEEEAEEQGRKVKSESKDKDDSCLLKSASAAVSVNPGKRRLRLTVHYRTWKPASVSVEAVLHGVKGAVPLGTSHARFRRSGVYRDTFELAGKQTKKALAAREVSVELQALNTPSSCRLHLTEAVRRTRH